VSHSKIRTEKICLNCGTETTGRYCPACGQENIEPKQTVWHLITHFFSDITHFDGKFFLTVKDLFAKPGFLSREYMIGRRVSYLDPIRMYIFTSAIFFLIFFSVVDVKKLNLGDDTKAEIQKDPELKALISKAKTSRDSLNILNGYRAAAPYTNVKPDSTQKGPIIHTKLAWGYASLAAYDSVQKALPPGERDGWFRRKVEIRKLEMNRRYEKQGSDLFRDILGSFIHEFPKALFVSLPVFALILKLLYFRQRQFYYVDHGIFAVHLFIFSFLILLVYFGVNEIRTLSGWGWLGWVNAIVLIYPFIYYYKAMRRFYGQGRGKTVLKYFLLFFLSLFIQIFIFVSFFLFSVFEA
jgi:hypothetical protein